LIEAATKKHDTDGFENQPDQQNQNKLRHKSLYRVSSIAAALNNRFCI